MSGLLLPGFVDAHVHLGLVDPGLLASGGLVAGGLAGVDDLGWEPTAAAEAWAPTSADPAEVRSGLPHVRYAGAFLSAPGGYPAGRSWAPSGAVEPVTSPDDAERAVARQAAHGASYIKVTLHSGGPMLDDATLAAVVASARGRALPIVAHAEGPGQAERALVAGVHRLAHTPWTERLSDDVVAAAAARQSWVSTLDIHGWGDPDAGQQRDQDVALDNLRRFAAAGGTVVYGTDLGNGPLPVGIDRRELAALVQAGLGAAALVRALTSRPVPGVATLVPADPCEPGLSADEVLDRLAAAQVVPAPNRPQEGANP